MKIKIKIRKCYFRIENCGKATQQCVSFSVDLCTIWAIILFYYNEQPNLVPSDVIIAFISLFIPLVIITLLTYKHKGATHKSRL